MAHTLSQLIGHLTGAMVGFEAWKREALEHAAKKIQQEAKRAIGTYKYDWPQLAESTQEQRIKLGYPANKPLLREGELRDSIEYVVHALEDKAYVGSNSDVAVWQELGTSRIPPRSFLVRAAIEKEHEIHEEISRGIAITIGTALGLTRLR